MKNVRFSSAGSAARLFVYGSIAALVAGGCSDDDGRTGPSVQVNTYCQDLFASPSFGCCSDADRQDRQFAMRNRYMSVADCAAQLGRQVSASQGRQSFDSDAAQSCLGHLAGKPCGAAPNASSRVAEDKAGCNRVVAGKQGEGQACSTHEDCKPGLVCPPAKDTGVSACAKPGSANQGCVGPSASVDHAPCELGLACLLVGENSVCPRPPCLDYRCIPLFDEGEACSGLECAAGLSCRDGFCRKGGPSAAGGSCRVLEHCEADLFCDPGTGQCAPRKAAGAPCRSDGNTLLECKGTCKQASGGPGVCASFCGSE